MARLFLHQTPISFFPLRPSSQPSLLPVRAGLVFPRTASALPSSISSHPRPLCRRLKRPLCSSDQPPPASSDGRTTTPSVDDLRPQLAAILLEFIGDVLCVGLVVLLTRKGISIWVALLPAIVLFLYIQAKKVVEAQDCIQKIYECYSRYMISQARCKELINKNVEELINTLDEYIPTK